jgi:hypothetical protein
MRKSWSWLVARLSEGSTWAAIAVFATAADHALQSHAGLAGAIMAGVLAFVIPDKK